MIYHNIVLSRLDNLPKNMLTPFWEGVYPTAQAYFRKGPRKSIFNFNFRDHKIIKILRIVNEFLIILYLIYYSKNLEFLIIYVQFIKKF